MIHQTRSIYEGYATMLQRLGLPFKMLQYSTLNELPHINVLAGQPPKKFPTIGYFAVGIGSAAPAVGTNGLAMTQTYIHDTDDSNLFYHVPFVTVPITNDISVVEQQKYALRTVEQINGQTYVSYWLKRLDLSTITTGLTLTSKNNASGKPEVWTPSQKQQSPDKILFKPGLNLASGDSLSAAAYFNLSLDDQDVSKLINAITIRTGDSSYARLSEITVCFGEDYPTSYSTATGQSQPFTEAVAVTPAIHFVGDWPLLSISGGLSLPIDLGCSEPMAKLTQL